MRNILRSVIARVSEPIFIVDANIKINYTNEAGSELVGLPSHQMEGKLISDCLHSPSIKRALEKAFDTDATDDMPVEVEMPHGEALFMNAKIGIVRNRDGEVSRAVVVLYPTINS